jgi:hypothetical protein
MIIVSTTLKHLEAAAGKGLGHATCRCPMSSGTLIIIRRFLTGQNERALSRQTIGVSRPTNCVVRQFEVYVSNCLRLMNSQTAIPIAPTAKRTAPATLAQSSLAVLPVYWTPRVGVAFPEGVPLPRYQTTPGVLVAPYGCITSTFMPKIVAGDHASHRRQRADLRVRRRHPLVQRGGWTTRKRTTAPPNGSRRRTSTMASREPTATTTRRNSWWMKMTMMARLRSRKVPHSLT